MSQLESRFAKAVMDALGANALPLPSVPDAALRVGQVCNDSRASAADVATEINKDPSIAVRLLRVANSAAQRGSHATLSVQHAVARLGLQTVRQLAYALSMQHVFLSESQMLKTRLRRSWAMSVEVAAIAHVLASRSPRLLPENAMLAGLIHQIGVLPIIKFAENLGADLPSEAELQVVLQHLQGSVGQAVLYAWGFPGAMVSVPVDCCDFARVHAGPPDCIDVVSVAVLLADQRNDRAYARLDRRAIPAFRSLGLDPEADPWQDEALCQQLEERLAWLKD